MYHDICFQTCQSTGNPATVCIPSMYGGDFLPLEELLLGTGGELLAACPPPSPDKEIERHLLIGLSLEKQVIKTQDFNTI